MEMLSVRQKDIVKDNIPKNTIFNLDCLTGMKQHIPDESIDIIICDPPYNFGKDFGNSVLSLNPLNFSTEDAVRLSR